MDASGEIQTLVNTTIINATTNTGKALQLPIAAPKTLSPLITNINKRNSMILTNFNHQSEFKNSNSKCHCSSSHQINKSNNCDDVGIYKESFSCDSISKSALETPNMLGCSSNTSKSSPAATPMISLSKSETNISVSTNIEDNRNQLAIFNVVSLNNLHENESFFDRSLTDLTKNQCLVNSSDNDLHELSPKKHSVILTSPKVLTTVTVSMRNTVDVSDEF